MILFSALAAIGASCGWAGGIVLAERPAKLLGAFEFTRTQLVACSAIMALICGALGKWSTITWAHWPSFAASAVIGIVLGNLAMIACLRRAGPRRTEILLTMKAPLVATMAFIWLGEVLTWSDALGGGVTLFGVAMAIAFGGNARSASDAMCGGLPTIILLGVCATVCQGFGFLVMKPAMVAGTDPLAASAIRLLGAAFLISLVALWPHRAFALSGTMTPALLARTILPGFIGYGVASSLLLFAFAHLDAGVAAVLGSLSPVMVLPILWVKEGIRPRAVAVIGAGIAVAGTAIIVAL